MVSIKDLISIPFVSGGRSISSGFDCWGLVMEVYRRCGIKLPDFHIDSFAFKAIDALANKTIQEQEWESVSPWRGKFPLVVLMRMHPKLITHAGVLIKNNRIIHTTKSTGCIISRAQALQSRIEGYYRYVPGN